jgi:hypothetical protein
MTDHHPGSHDQKRYGAVLHWATLAGFVILVCTFLAYVLGLVAPFVPLNQLPQLWKLPANEYAQAAHMPTGWNWVKLLGKGDVLPLLGIAVLSGSSIVSILSVVPVYLKEKNYAYTVISLLTVAVLLLSASDVIGFHR